MWPPAWIREGLGGGREKRTSFSRSHLLSSSLVSFKTTRLWSIWVRAANHPVPTFTCRKMSWRTLLGFSDHLEGGSEPSKDGRESGNPALTLSDGCLNAPGVTRAQAHLTLRMPPPPRRSTVCVGTEVSCTDALPGEEKRVWALEQRRTLRQKISPRKILVHRASSETSKRAWFGFRLLHLPCTWTALVSPGGAGSGPLTDRTYFLQGGATSRKPTSRVWGQQPPWISSKEYPRTSCPWRWRFHPARKYGEQTGLPVRLPCSASKGSPRLKAELCVSRMWRASPTERLLSQFIFWMEFSPPPRNSPRTEALRRRFPNSPRVFVYLISFVSPFKRFERLGGRSDMLKCLNNTYKRDESVLIGFGGPYHWLSFSRAGGGERMENRSAFLWKALWPRSHSQFRFWRDSEKIWSSMRRIPTGFSARSARPGTLSGLPPAAVAGDAKLPFFSKFHHCCDYANTSDARALSCWSALGCKCLQDGQWRPFFFHLPPPRRTSLSPLSHGSSSWNLLLNLARARRCPEVR